MNSVLTAGLTELATNWATRRALIISWDQAGQPSVIGGNTSWAGLSPSIRAAINRIRATRRAHWQSGDGLVDSPEPAVVGTLIPAGTEVSVAWLELDLTQHLTSEDAALLADLAVHIGQALTRARMFDEQRTASLTLQRAILGPTGLPVGFAVRYEPAVSHLVVGGDWHDLVELGADRVGVAVGDCVGHGLGAVAVMGQLRTACRTLLLEAHTASQVLTAMDGVVQLIPDAVCTTLFCATIDRANGHHALQPRRPSWPALMAALSSSTAPAVSRLPPGPLPSRSGHQSRSWQHGAALHRRPGRTSPPRP